MSVAELPDAARQCCRPEVRARLEALAAEFETLKPTIDALMERAADAYSEIELAAMSVEFWDAQTEDEFALSSGSRRLWGAVNEIHMATAEWELQNDEFQAAQERERWVLYMECHGDTDPCFESSACMKVLPYDPKWVRLVQLVDRGHLDEILRRYPA